MRGVLAAAGSARDRVRERIASRPLPVGRGRGLVSFTFDDVPRNVLDNALPTLEEAGLAATFYVAPRMPEAPDNCDDDDVAFLAARGHDIGCHTLTHYSLRTGTPEGLYRDALGGKRHLEAVAGRPVDHFAFPFGEVTIAAKRCLQPLFLTLRTSAPGINRGRVDRNFLRARSLYSRTFEPASLRRWLRSLRDRGGWLILYTHDVTDDPGPYGTTVHDFRTAVALATESGTPVRTISGAFSTLSDRPPRTTLR